MPGTFDTPVSDVIRRALIALGHGTDPPLTTWPVYISSLPDQPDNIVSVYDQTGRDRGRVMQGERTEMHGIQVIVRSKGNQYKEGWVKARNIAVAFDNMNMTEVTVSGHRYLIWSVSRTTEVIDAGQEEMASKRRLFTVNAVANVRQKS